eukprot:scaffold82654_cov20-Tisochrysis_lutea.AAC.1
MRKPPVLLLSHALLMVHGAWGCGLCAVGLRPRVIECITRWLWQGLVWGLGSSANSGTKLRIRAGAALPATAAEASAPTRAGPSDPESANSFWVA